MAAAKKIPAIQFHARHRQQGRQIQLAALVLGACTRLKRSIFSTPAAATTEAPKMGNTRQTTKAESVTGQLQVTARFGGTPDRPFGRRTHHDASPVAVSQISESANAVLIQTLAIPKLP
jgi:hypothetical protein